MKIYDPNGDLLLEIIPDDNSYRYRVIMGEHTLTLYYSLATHVELPVGAYCDFEGSRYTLMDPEQIKMRHTRLFEYTVVFSADQDKAKIWKFRNTVDGRLRFSLTARPAEHLQMIVDNMNRRDSGWTVGDCIEDVEKLVTYDHDYCWDALVKIASGFNTEFEFNSKSISLKKIEYNKSNPLPLAYGKGNGFRSGIGRSSGSRPVEILYVQGGDRNIDRSKYPDKSNEGARAASNGCLLLPCNQTLAFDGEHFEDEDGFNAAAARHYKADTQGLYIFNHDRSFSSCAEDSLDCSDSYPSRVGTISEVTEVDEAKNFYDFTDETIPEELNYEDCLIEGETMTVVFQSGELAGREFDVRYCHNPKNGKAGRRFEIVPQEIDGVTMPGDSFIPAAGNKYAIFNVMLPPAYIRNDTDKSGGSWDMFRKAVRHLFDNEDPKFTFTGELDPIWTKKDWNSIGAKIKPGGFILFSNEQFAPGGALIRITSVKDYINNPHCPKIELSNEVRTASVGSAIKQLKSEEVAVEENHKAALQYSRRRYRDAAETMKMLQKAMLDNFSPAINPITVNTMSMLVGDESLQFSFTQNADSNVTVEPQITFSPDTLCLTIPQSFIRHHTLGINTIKAEHSPDEYRRWSIDAFTSAPLTDPDKNYYLYALVPEDGSNGVFVLEESPKKMRQTAGSLYLLAGILNSQYGTGGGRSFAKLCGFTEVLPGRITTDVIVSDDGETYFNLREGIIGGKIRFKAGSSGLTNIEEYNTLSQAVETNKTDIVTAAANSRAEITRLNDTLIYGGFIRTGLINTDELIARRLIAGDQHGQRIEIDPVSKSIQIISEDGTTTVFEGNQYSDPTTLFGNSAGNIDFITPSGTKSVTGQNSLFETIPVCTPFHTATPVEIKLTAQIRCSAHCDPNRQPETGPGQSEITTPVESQFATASVFLWLATYADEQCTQPVARKMLLYLDASADGSADSDGTHPNTNAASERTLLNHKTVTSNNGYHRLEIIANLDSTSGGASVSWGSSAGNTATSGSYISEYYVSRYFNNGYLLGTSKTNYILAYRHPQDGMCLVAQNGTAGFRLTAAGVEKKNATGEWIIL